MRMGTHTYSSNMSQNDTPPPSKVGGLLERLGMIFAYMQEECHFFNDIKYLQEVCHVLELDATIH